jgi:aminomethyltransferase
MDEPTKSVWHDIQAQQGASFEEIDGWLWTTTLGDPDGEYAALHDHVGMLDASPLRRWEFSGPDANRALQRLFTNDVTHAATGDARYGAVVDEHGKMWDDALTYRLADDRSWLVTNSPVGDLVSRACADLNVEANDRTNQLALLSLYGPHAGELLKSVADDRLRDLPYFRFVPEPISVGGAEAWVARTGIPGELGYEVFAEIGNALAVWESFKDLGVRVIGLRALEIVRIEAGVIVFGVDYVPGELTPYDVSLDRFVTEKADVEYFGKEALREAAEKARTRLVTLRIDNANPPPAGSAVIRDGERVGTLTSPTLSPKFGPIGLAVVEANASQDGASVDVQTDVGPVAAHVSLRPLHDPDRLRSRA